MKKSTVLEPTPALASQSTPPASSPRAPPTADASRTSPPNCGVNPPGNCSWKEKQRGSSNTRASAAGSGRSRVTGTAGQPADPSATPSCASSASPISRVRPPSALKTALRVLGLRKKKPLATRRLA